MALGRKKIRIELEDAEGGKYNLSLEGNISKDKIVKIFEFMDLLNIETETASPLQAREAPVSIGDRIWRLVEAKLPYSNFTSSDLLELYEDEYNEPIKLSIISTYLSRYSERGKLQRNRHGKEWVYRYRSTTKPIGDASPDQLRQVQHEIRPREVEPFSSTEPDLPR